MNIRSFPLLENAILVWLSGDPMGCDSCRTNLGQLNEIVLMMSMSMSMSILINLSRSDCSPKHYQLWEKVNSCNPSFSVNHQFYPDLNSNRYYRWLFRGNIFALCRLYAGLRVQWTERSSYLRRLEAFLVTDMSLLATLGVVKGLRLIITIHFINSRYTPRRALKFALNLDQPLRAVMSKTHLHPFHKVMFGFHGQSNRYFLFSLKFYVTLKLIKRTVEIVRLLMLWEHWKCTNNLLDYKFSKWLWSWIRPRL